MAEAPEGHFDHAQDSFADGELVDFQNRRSAPARLWLLFESLSPRVAGRRTALRRDASLHSHLRVVVRRAGHRDSGRTSRATAGQIKIRFVAHYQSHL